MVESQEFLEEGSVTLDDQLVAEAVQEQERLDLEREERDKRSRDHPEEDVSPVPVFIRRIRQIPCKLWIFTINNYTEETITTLTESPDVSHYVFQEEKSQEGTPHLQGVLRLRVKKRLNWLKTHINERAHWEKCTNLGGSIIYCSRETKRRGQKRIWTKVWTVQKNQKNQTVQDPLEGKDLYNYQERIIDMVVGVPADRKIFWFWSEKGNIGKSSLVKHLCLKNGAVCIGGKFSDALYAIAERAKTKKTVKVLLFDIPRSQGNKISFVAIESVKNGCFFSSKYESSMCLINTPHVIIFANERPNTSQLSMDRWEITCLDDEEDLSHL